MASSKTKFTWAQAFRDIGVAAVNRGQLLAFGFFALTGLIILKLSGDAVQKDMTDLIAELKGGCFLGYLLAGFLLAGWIVHARYLLRRGHQEQERIAGERNKAQALLGVTTGSSK